MLLLKKNDLEVASQTPHVTAEEAATVASAGEILAAAEAEAARIAEAAKAAYEDEKRRGYADGLAAARADELERKLSLVDAATAYMEKVEQTMGELVIKALRKCVMEIGDRELVMQIVRKSMQAVVRTQRQITVKVAPDMVETVKARLNDILSGFPSVAYADVVEDAHLAPTACIVETDAGSVESSIDGQIASIEKSIRRQFSKDAS